MNLGYITEYMNEKIEKSERFITVSFFELRVKENLSKEDTYIFLRMSKQRLLNLGYKIYETGDTYMYNGQEQTVESNVLYIAIKD